MKRLVLILICSSSFALSASSSDETVTVTVPALGEVVGSVGETAWSKRPIYQFYSIQYAESPTGPLRFMPPKPIKSWNGIYDATTPGKECPQIRKWKNLEPRELNDDPENCLTLNVFTPTKSGSSQDDLLPVLVFIHGGSFVKGSAKEYPPNYLLEKDIILVVIQYRLGPLGFLSLGTDGISGNAGLLDQVEALRWINKHIQYFGGDNTRITLNGQSSGAGTLTMHLLSPMVEPNLFQQVIVQSGSVHSNWAINENPVPFVRAVYSRLKNNFENADDSITEAALKNANLNDLFIAVNMENALNPFKEHCRPVIQKSGSKYLTMHPKNIIKSGRFRKVPAMVGVVKHEGSFVAVKAYDVFDKLKIVNDPSFLKYQLVKECLSALEVKDDSGTMSNILIDKHFQGQVFDKKSNLTFADMAPGLVDILGNIVCKGPAFNYAKTNVLFGMPTYLYTFDYSGSTTLYGKSFDATKYPFDGGVFHNDDLLYLFPSPYTAPLSEEDTKIAKLMVDLWTNFVIHGTPSSPEVALWPPMSKGGNGPYYHIDSISYVEDDFVRNEFMAATNEKHSLILKPAADASKASEKEFCNALKSQSEEMDVKC